MTKKLFIFILTATLCFIVIRFAVTSSRTEKIVETIEYYTITEHSVNESRHFVTMKEKDGTEEVVFEIGEDEFNSFGFSENETLLLDVKTKGSSTEYSYNGKRLMTKESADKTAKLILLLSLAVGIVAGIIIGVIKLKGVVKQ